MHIDVTESLHEWLLTDFWSLKHFSNKGMSMVETQTSVIDAIKWVSWLTLSIKWMVFFKYKIGVFMAIMA